ncbi:class I lanthipeptide [Kordia sp.]|uniref:class I lanthipeptide n=1 Tax=Kordia sp. TaxID=1965332 RepID=UPI0025C23B8C|nr:class I lanthipeptide [Kordia sp.]MCH2194677.1 class I lanthipeptide [Kordia sp.]
MKKQRKLSLQKSKIAKINYTTLHRIKGGTITDSDTTPTAYHTCNTTLTSDDCNTNDTNCNTNETSCTTVSHQTTTQQTREQGGNSVITCGIDPIDGI